MLFDSSYTGTMSGGTSYFLDGGSFSQSDIVNNLLVRTSDGYKLFLRDGTRSPLTCPGLDLIIMPLDGQLNFEGGSSLTFTGLGLFQ